MIHYHMSILHKTLGILHKTLGILHKTLGTLLEYEWGEVLVWGDSI